jgi:hypothetical protein
MSDGARQAPVVSGHHVLSAGFAAATAAFVTSRFGVAGTLLGAALTAMIITGGSAILKAYLQSVTGNARKVPRKLRERRDRRKAGRSAEPDTMPGRPDLRDNFAGRMRAALDWFSHLPSLTRRSILVRGLITAVVAFVIGMGAVYTVERGIGNSLSCGIWANCPDEATPGIHPGGGDGTGANSTLSLGRAKTNAAPGSESRNPAFQQNPSYQQQGPGNQRPAPFGNEPDQRPALSENEPDQRPALSENEPDQRPALSENEPDQRPAPSGNEPGQRPAPSGNEPGQRPAPSGNEPKGGGVFERPVEQEVPAQPETPNSASPAPEEQAPLGREGAPAREVVPSDASPAPSE